MNEYKAIFKCRLCGEIYKSQIAGRVIAVQSVISACNNNIEPISSTAPSITEPHFCKDDSIGVADFQGFRREETK